MAVVQFGPIASFALVIFVVIFAFIGVASFAVIAFAIKKIEQQIEKLTNMAEPIIVKASNTLDTVQRITVNVGEKADSILTKGETLTDTVAEKVGKTATTVQETVTGPLVKFSSVLSGLSAGLNVWSRSATSHAKNDVASPGPMHKPNGTTSAEERVTVLPNGR